MKNFREQCGLEQTAGPIQLDASGLKKLFSHGIRRFCDADGNYQVRDTCACLILTVVVYCGVTFYDDSTLWVWGFQP